MSKKSLLLYIIILILQPDKTALTYGSKGIIGNSFKSIAGNT